MSKKNYSVARVVTHTQSTIGKCERHNERKNESYANMNVDTARCDMNVHFRDCGELTYNEQLNKLVAEKKVCMRGLKADAKVFDEVIFDVNTDYFETHGGYEYAKDFYEEAYRFAVALYGEQNIISAVMHADELNVALTEQYGKPVYHYHMHLVALPVVEKQILWTKRCKDKSLVGTVKETVNQISHSKKWKSPQAVDENGNVVFNEKGKPVLIPSYSILQDDFFNHMQRAGFNDFIRGEKGSTAEHLSCLQYEIQQDKKRLEEIKERLQTEEVRYDEIQTVHKTFNEIDGMGKKTLTGKVTISSEDFNDLSNIIKRKIFINKTFTKKMANTSSSEYREYERVVSLNPTFEVVVTTQKTYDRNKYRLGYKFIEAYIYCHAPDNESRKIAIAEYIEERWKALGHRCGQHEVRAWFLKKYPDFDDMYFESKSEPARSEVEEFMEQLGYFDENGKLVEPTGIKLLTA